MNKLKRLGYYEFAVVMLIIVASFLPLIRTEDVWSGFGSHGSHFYKSGFYELYYSDHTSGVGKPEIYLTNGHDRTPLIEFSDHTSWIGWLNLYYDFEVRVKTHDSILEAAYNGGGVELIKTVEPGEKYIKVKYYSSNPQANLTVSLWRWYFEDVSGITKYNWRVSKIQPVNELRFSFRSSETICEAKLLIYPLPKEILVNGDQLGIDKIVLSFEAKTVELALEADTGCLNNSITLSSMYIYPIIAGVLSAGYLVLNRFCNNVRTIDRWSKVFDSSSSRVLREPLFLALASGMIRLALAPFSCIHGMSRPSKNQWRTFSLGEMSMRL
ncbi:MAG: hypothetical protein NZ920_05975 [Aigarchaeota archaeon]|nr:hypothetical protein [Aigarchaeota archaeon]MDW8092654.1 hypothetical protein [Nitrososphaerota archaeon]